jgi:hypothetical protein
MQPVEGLPRSRWLIQRSPAPRSVNTDGYHRSPPFSGALSKLMNATSTMLDYKIGRYLEIS